MAAMREPRVRLLSLDEAVEAVYQAALSGRGVAETAAELAHDIDDRDVNDAVVIGLAVLAHRKLTRQRRAGTAEDDGAEVVDEVAVMNGPATPPAKAKPHYALDYRRALTANYEAADGSRKPLLEFNLDDALNLRKLSGARADGLIRVRDAMDRAVSALQKHKAERIADLPVKDQREIAEGLG
jgi:hypothetical protein